MGRAPRVYQKQARLPSHLRPEVVEVLSDVENANLVMAHIGERAEALEQELEGMLGGARVQIVIQVNTEGVPYVGWFNPERGVDEVYEAVRAMGHTLAATIAALLLDEGNDTPEEAS